MGASTAVPLSGRDDELLTLLEIVRLGTSGSPQAVLVRGEAGVGKTALVRAVVERVRAEGVQVLWGQALRFGAVEAAYHPLVLALEGWLAGAGQWVYERSRGNPFFTELLVRRTPPGTDLRNVLPDELSRALLESWRALGPSAREMTRLLAVAGGPRR